MTGEGTFKLRYFPISQGSTKLFPRDHMGAGVSFWYKKDSNAKKEGFWCAEPSRLLTKFYHSEKENKKRKWKFFITTILCFPQSEIQEPETNLLLHSSDYIGYWVEFSKPTHLYTSNAPALSESVNKKVWRHMNLREAVPLHKKIKKQKSFFCFF